MEASFHQQLGFARANELDGFLRRRLAVRGVDDLDAPDVELERLCDAANLLSGPTRIGEMMPASAASSVPLSELSSQGCATAVASGCRFAVAATNRSYFSC